MKRFISILMVTIISVMLMGCGGSSSPEGVYKVKTMDGKTLEESLKEELDGMDLDSAMKMLGIESLDDFMTLELKSDGSASISAMGEDASTGTWKKDGSKVTITIDDEPMDFTLSGKELKGKFKDDEGEHEYVFVKK